MKFNDCFILESYFVRINAKHRQRSKKASFRWYKYECDLPHHTHFFISSHYQYLPLFHEHLQTLPKSEVKRSSANKLISRMNQYHSGRKVMREKRLTKRLERSWEYKTSMKVHHVNREGNQSRKQSLKLRAKMITRARKREAELIKQEC